MNDETVTIEIYESDAGEIFKATKVLKRSGYLGNSSINITPNKQDRTITVVGSNLQDVEHAMKVYNKTLAKDHGGIIRYKISSNTVSEIERIESDIRKECQKEILDLKKTQSVLESKWSKERIKYQDDIQGMRDIETELRFSLDLSKKEYEALETELKNFSMDLTEEKILTENLNEVTDKLSDSLKEAYTNLESLRKEHEDYVNMPLYKLFFKKVKDIFSK